MTKIIRCDDGYVARGATDDELVENALAHVRDTRPELVGSITREQLLARANERRPHRSRRLGPPRPTTRPPPASPAQHPPSRAGLIKRVPTRRMNAQPRPDDRVLAAHRVGAEPVSPCGRRRTRSATVSRTTSWSGQRTGRHRCRAAPIVL
jgi:hypothetical protein